MKAGPQWARGLVVYLRHHWVTLEIVVDDDIAKRDPFTKIGRTVTQGDFPTIVAAIRNQNRAEFGEDADRPD